MDADLRARFNAGWSPELARTVREDLERRLGCGIPFPVAETPMFLSAELRDRFAQAGDEIMALLCDPDWIAEQEQFVPNAYRSDYRGELPQVAQIDFAVTRGPDGEIQPRCVELQGFPSLYAFQVQLADVWATHLAMMPGMPDAWRLFFHGRDRYQALALLRETLVGDHDPEEVVLLDIDPVSQKTFPDFEVTRRWWGIDPVCLTELKRDGSKLLRHKAGRTIPVKRVYQRIVMDEMEQRHTPAPFAFHEQLDVEWVPHPAWFFLWSKRSLLALDHWSVPATTLLSDLTDVPDDLSGYVLKPLYSFAGAGVNVDPTPRDVAAVPEAKRSEWVLQEKVDYCDALRTPDGDPVKAELRLMFVRPDGHDKLELLLNLGRLSRGKMMGVDFNKDLAWTGASVAIWRDDR